MREGPLDNGLIMKAGTQQCVLVNTPEEAYPDFWTCKPENHLSEESGDGLCRVIFVNGKTMVECAYCGATEDLT